MNKLFLHLIGKYLEHKPENWNNERHVWGVFTLLLTLELRWEMSGWLIVSSSVILWLSHNGCLHQVQASLWCVGGRLEGLPQDSQQAARGENWAWGGTDNYMAQSPDSDTEIPQWRWFMTTCVLLTTSIATVIKETNSHATCVWAPIQASACSH